jgi:hypothetical protein
MTNLRRKITLGVITLALAASAFAVAAPKVAHAESTCFFSVYSHEFYHFKTLSDGNYLDLAESFEQIPASGCTQWAGHHYGDMYVIDDYQLGTTADFFNNNQGSNLRIEGWNEWGYGNAYPGSGNPFANGCTGLDTWANCSGVPFVDYPAGEFNDPYYLGGTNGNTNLEVTSTELTGAPICSDNFYAMGNANTSVTLVISNANVRVPQEVYDEPVGWNENNPC